MQYRPRRPLATILLSVAVLVISMAGPLASASAATFYMTYRPVASGFDTPTQITSARDGSGRLFIVERRGTIKAIANNGAGATSTFMSITGLVEDGGERGLLGLAFHPNFATNRTLFVYYTRNGGDIVLARYQTNVARTAVVNSTGRLLLVIEHSAYSNHNGGSLAFGPDDGYLYIGTGDGGGGGDPDNNARNKNSLLGKILRIDVNGTGSGPFGRYRNPSTNPFVGSIPGRSEIWAYGLRNPWRISLDRGSRRLFIADVGQNRYMRKWTVRTASAAVGRTTAGTGWKASTATRTARSRATPCRSSSTHMSTATARSRAATSTAAPPRRSSSANTCSRISAAGGSGRPRWDGATRTQRRDTSFMVTSFGESDVGELYLATIDGRVFQVIAS